MTRSPLLWVTAVGVLATLSSCGGGGAGAGAGNNATVTMVTTTIPDTATGLAYAAQFEALFPHSPGVFLVTSGALPPGLKLDKFTGEISGYPRQTGTFHFEIAARDGADEVPLGGGLPDGRDANFAEDRHVFSMNVSLGLPNILPQTVPAAQYRASYSYQIQMAGGTAPYTFVETNGPNLPTGLAVTSTGTLGFFPTQARQEPYTFEVTVTDANGLTDTATLTVQVLVLPLIFLTSDPIRESAINTPYDLQLQLASGGAGAPYIWAQAPPTGTETNLATIGMEINSLGHFKDTFGGPTALGTFTFTASVTDEIGQIALQHFTFKVNPGPVLTSISPNRSSTPGPYTAKGLNFQPGAKLIFKPGPTQITVAPTFVDDQTLTFASVQKPSGGSGGVDVMVVNPDSGNYTKTAAFVFPATTISYGTKGFISSNLSSTGLAAADVTGDGLADLLHCGAANLTPYSGGATSTNGGLILLRSAGGSPPSFNSTTLDGGSFYDCKFVDFNLDGKLDIIALGQTQIRTWINNPLGTFVAGPTTNLPTGTLYPATMAVGKLNSDALLDVAVGYPHNPSFGFANYNGRVDLFMGNGAGQFVLQDQALTTMPWQYGVLAMACIDTDGNGRDELAVGVGMGNYIYSSPMNYAPTLANGSFGTWTSPGAVVYPPYYGSTTSVVAADFQGNGGKQLISAQSGTYGAAVRVFSLFTNTGLTTQTAISPPGTVMKNVAAVDSDFDEKMDFAVTTVTSNILVYKGGTFSPVATLDAAVGSPSISSPRTGFLASGDIDGDGRPDVICTTSYWQVEEMAANYGASYVLGNTGNGGQLGIVYFLNSSN